jgi:hypothetical protein
MSLHRRAILKGGLAVSALALLPRTSFGFAPKPQGWRSFQVVTRVELAAVKGKPQAWVPVPAVNEADWFKPLGSSWTSNGTAVAWRDPKYGAELVHATWAGSRGDQPVRHSRPRRRPRESGARRDAE